MRPDLFSFSRAPLRPEQDLAEEEHMAGHEQHLCASWAFLSEMS